MIADRLGTTPNDINLNQALDFIKLDWKIHRTNIYGEIKKIEHIEDLEYMDNKNAPDCGILVFTSYEEVDIKHYIYAVFLPEILK
uniref:hypothetical protein n=1 Tax=Ornithobacterium rhinotracheale TaxID=28251 RepID=UPI0039A700D0